MRRSASGSPRSFGCSGGPFVRGAVGVPELGDLLWTQRYAPMTADVCQDLLDLVRNDLQPKTEAPKAPARAASSREELTAALVHRPEPRRAQSGPAM